MTRVHIIGTGLIGTSLGLALTKAGYAVTLEDQSPTAAALAADLGAGVVGRPASSPDMVIVGAPPDVTGALVVEALARWPESIVTDVASVKGSVLSAVATAAADTARYVGCHPMAGRERSGVMAARGDLFEGRAWVVAPGPDTRAGAVDAVAAIGRDVGGAVSVLPPAEHDAAVAAVSHVPQLAASLVAARLTGLPDSAVGLAGPGLRDVTRIAASDSQLWTQILTANAAAVGVVLDALIADLSQVRTALAHLEDTPQAEAPGARATIAAAIEDGNLGYARLPGKHGGAQTAYVVVSVVVPDAPGELGRLLHDVGEAGVNVEELHLDHGLGMPFGLAEILVVPDAAARLERALADAGWRLHG
ncbi:MAG: prephenate dehydrogenase [Nostocoides sp.]